MQNKEEVYYLTINQAQAFEKDHQADENWDLWTDYVARAAGKYNRAFIYNGGEATQQGKAKAS